ncbi:unnamed protein product [Oppiella nova]|uniref:Uncharacterized protein n=1 Tax=Oppiella nova TaxID=334625 RepID=A0A7R9MDA4_9ACAR|nr:unnamed protein product [Oppiella nova]CAG2175111.1 unnamed protein product [Oppiella nova]
MGHNRYGQLGCGPDSDILYGDTIRVNFSPNHEIKSIYCCLYSSFAITSEGQVFSWGRNDFYQLGHNSSDNIWEPQLIADMTELSNNGMNWVEVSFIEYCMYRQLVIDFTTNSVIDIVSEVNEYNRLYEELHSLGSGAFGEYN